MYSVKIEPIPVTKLEKDLKFPTLDLRFSDSAARLEDMKKTVAARRPARSSIGRQMDVGRRQTSIFQTNGRLAGRSKIQNHLRQEIFSAARFGGELRLRIHRRRRSRSPSKNFNYIRTRPIRPNVKITATLELTHAVEPGELDRHLQLMMIGGSEFFRRHDPAPHFSLTYGLHKRLAYLRSSNVTLPEKEDFMKLELSKGVRTAQGGAQTHAGNRGKAANPFDRDRVSDRVYRRNHRPEQEWRAGTGCDL